MAKRIFITGVSSGIGEALAHAFLGLGAELFGVCRRQPNELIAQTHFHFRSLDLTEFEKAQNCLHELFDGVNDLDLVVLNAGVLGKVHDLADTPLAELRHVMEVNVWANKVVLDTLFGLPMKIQQVVAISSGAAVSATRGFGAYCISKAALNMLIRLYAVERPETHFAAIAPGIVDTAMQEYMVSLPVDERFPAVEMLKSAKGTVSMPDPKQAAPRLMSAFAKALDFPSGEFMDIQALLRPGRA